MKPTDILRSAFFFVCGAVSSRTLDKPGAVIRRLPSEYRKILSSLKSDDIKSKDSLDRDILDCMRVENSEEEKLSQEKMDFDKKMTRQYE